MAVVENVKFELDGRLRPLDLGKHHVSVRYEAGPRVVFIGACLDNYNWDNRAQVIDALLDFEESHSEEFAVQFDVIPLEGVIDQSYADA